MDKIIVDKIIQSIDESNTGSKVAFSDRRYHSYVFSKENFSAIENAENGRKIAFIDGGNAEIISGANFSLQLVRVYSAIWQSNERIYADRKEFFILVNSITEKSDDKNNGDGKIKFSAQIFGDKLVDESELVYDSMDGTLMTGIHRASPAKVAEIARRFSELKMCEIAAERLGKGDIAVLDGSLQSSVTNESGKLKSLYNIGKQRGVIIAAFSKTNRLFTDTGNSASYTLQKMAVEDEANELASGLANGWAYYPVVDIMHPDHQAEMMIVKLHKNAKHVFRLEVQKEMFAENFDAIPELLWLLKENAKDPVFLGYPYGLIDADRFARISSKEVERLKMELMLKAGDKREMLLEKLSAVNAHEILDNIG